MKDNKTKSPIIKQDKDNEIPVEILAKAIVEVSEAARKLLNSRLSKRAILILIKDTMQGRGVPLSDIELVLDCAARLDKRYIK